jgi:large subunit ribosomal protein L24
MKFKKGDKVIIITGKDKGKEGTIERIYKKSDKVLIPTLNMYKKHMKKGDQFPQGGIIDVPRPIHVSNVMIKCPKTGKPTRIGIKEEKGKKQRYSKKDPQTML